MTIEMNQTNPDQHPRDSEPPSVKELLPHLARLHRQLVENATDREARKIILDQVQYAVSGVVYWLFEFAKAETEIVSPYREAVNAHIYRGVSFEQRNRLAHIMDAFLGVARRTQDFSLRQIGARFGGSIPQSMHALVKENKFPETVPNEVKKLVCEYWQKDGILLKEYRDLSMHAAIVASEVTVLLRPGSEPHLSVLMPNNPTQKSPSKLCYERPTVQASTFMQESTYSLLAFVHRLATLLSASSDQRRLTSAFGVRAVVGFCETNFTAPIKADQLRKKLLSEFGEPETLERVQPS